jgi:hypothetical protein
VRSDAVFGPLVVFGLGGVGTDLVADRCARLAPLTGTDADLLLDGLRSSARLWSSGIDRAAIRDVLLRVSRLVELVPEIAELDLNPVVTPEPAAWRSNTLRVVGTSSPSNAEYAQYASIRQLIEPASGEQMPPVAAGALETIAAADVWEETRLVVVRPERMPVFMKLVDEVAKGSALLILTSGNARRHHVLAGAALCHAQLSAAAGGLRSRAITRPLQETTVRAELIAAAALPGVPARRETGAGPEPTTRQPALTFYGGAEASTGGRYLLETAGARVRVACGLFEGAGSAGRRNWSPAPPELHGLDAIVLTSARATRPVRVLARLGCRRMEGTDLHHGPHRRADSPCPPRHRASARRRRSRRVRSTSWKVTMPTRLPSFTTRTERERASIILFARSSRSVAGSAYTP